MWYSLCAVCCVAKNNKRSWTLWIFCCTFCTVINSINLVFCLFSLNVNTLSILNKNKNTTRKWKFLNCNLNCVWWVGYKYNFILDCRCDWNFTINRSWILAALKGNHYNTFFVRLTHRLQVNTRTNIFMMHFTVVICAMALTLCVL